MPGLASALPKVSDGGKTYTFTLRPNLKFSNGAAITPGGGQVDVPARC